MSVEPKWIYNITLKDTTNSNAYPSQMTIIEKGPNTRHMDTFFMSEIAFICHPRGFLISPNFTHWSVCRAVWQKAMWLTFLWSPLCKISSGILKDWPTSQLQTSCQLPQFEFIYGISNAINMFSKNIFGQQRLTFIKGILLLNVISLIHSMTKVDITVPIYKSRRNWDFKRLVTCQMPPN